MLSYRKTREGDWAVFGPASEVRPGTVSVTKKDGSVKTERVVKVSQSFEVEGVPHAFGYLAQREPAARSSGYSGRGGYRRRPSCSCSCHRGGGCCRECQFDGCEVAEEMGLPEDC